MEPFLNPNLEKATHCSATSLAVSTGHFAVHAQVLGKTTGTFYVSTSFCGGPIGRRLASSPNREAVMVAHAADPNGTPRCMLCWKSGSLRKGLWLLDEEEGTFGVCRELDEIDMTVAQEPLNHRG